MSGCYICGRKTENKIDGIEEPVCVVCVKIISAISWKNFTQEYYGGLTEFTVIGDLDSVAVAAWPARTDQITIDGESIRASWLGPEFTATAGAIIGDEEE